MENAFMLFPEKQLFKEISLSMQDNGSAVRATSMKKYMKDKFEFYGVSSVLRKEIISKAKRKQTIVTLEQLKIFINLCWEDNHREMQYVALDVMRPFVKKMDTSWIPFIIQLIRNKSWWDSVDFLATNVLGPILKNTNTAEFNTFAYSFSEEEDLWIRRSSIIFQLKYKKEMRKEILLDMILAQHSEKNFFIRKAIGWVLREYGKTNPVWVSELILNHGMLLSPLSLREAKKYLPLREN